MQSTDIEGIGQIAICVDDMQTSRTFYKDILGLTLLFDAGPNLSFFDCGGIRLMLTTLQGKEEDHNTSVIYYKVSDIEAVFKAFEKQDVVIERPPQLAAKMTDHHLWMGFIRDPNANLIGIMAEVPSLKNNNNS